MFCTHHFFVFGLALFLEHHVALGYPLCDAILGLPLLVLRVPHGDVLRPALHPGVDLPLDRDPSSQAETTDDEEEI